MKNNINAILIGGAIGDGLGLQFETLNWNNPEILSWDGKTFGPSAYHKTKGGETSDDTAMSVALTESLVENKKFIPELVAKKYLEWYNGPKFCGAGDTTRKALSALNNGVTWYESGIVGALGNGTAMRAAPLGIFYNEGAEKYARLDAMITHHSYEAQQGSTAIALIIAMIINRQPKEVILENILYALGTGPVYENIKLIKTNKIIADTLYNKNYDIEKDKKGGNRIISQLILGAKYTAVEVVARALYVFLATNSFQEAIELVIRAGGDSDTAASIVGNLAGAYYGLNLIPQALISKIENKDYILELGAKLSSSI